MERDRQQKKRNITLSRQGDGTYAWTCSECEWEHPFDGPNDTPVSPMEAINQFSRHSCGKHPNQKDKPDA